MKKRVFLGAAASLMLSASLIPGVSLAQEKSKEIVYITPSLSVSFWRYVSTGVQKAAENGGYTFKALDSNNDAQTQLKNMQDAIARGVAGIVISPTDSSTAPSALNLAEKAGIPVSIADIGTDSGEFVSFVSSDNIGGARGIGRALAAKLKEKGWTDGSYGIIGIPQARINGQLRTKGFRQAMAEIGMKKEIPMKEMQTFTADESFRYAQDMLTSTPDLRAIFVQSDQQTIGALRAIKAARKTDSVLIAGFDGTPELFELIKKGDVVGSGMQQPYLMGYRAADALVGHGTGCAPQKEIVVPILVGTTDNADSLKEDIKLNVFAGEI